MTVEVAVSALAQKARQIAGALERLTYFQLLRVPEDAPPAEIRAAYHRMAQLFHPDKYNHLGDAQLTADLGAISKRVAEAYMVLRDPQKSKAYREALAQSPSTVRYQHKDRVARTEQDDAALGKSPKVRQMVGQATHAWQQGNKSQAISALKMALLYEKDNPRLEALLREWQNSQ